MARILLAEEPSDECPADDGHARRAPDVRRREDTAAHRLQRDETEVSKPIGARDAFTPRPSYYFGLLQGLAGGVVALGIVAGALALLNREVRPLAESYGSGFALAFPAANDAFAIVLFAALLGWLGAQLSVSRHLRQIEPA